MANVWMTIDEMNANFPLHAVDTFGTIWSAQYLNTSNEYVDCPNAEKEGAYDRGVGDTTCDMSWWTGGGAGGNSRYICKYNLYCTRFAADQPVLSDRRLKIQFPIYMRNVKFLDIGFLIWIDLGWARGASLAAYNDVSAVAYTKDGETLNLYCIPTPGNDHPGTARIAEGAYGPGFVPFHFVYNDDANPIDIDFIEITSSGAYTDRHPSLQYDYFSFWIVQPCYNEDAEFVENPEPTPQEGDWGDPIERAGGHGSFSDPSDDSGAFDGTALAADIAAHAAIMNANIQAGGFHVYRLAAGAMATITRVLFSQSFFGLFTVSRYNPLSCMLSYHLLPETLAPLTLDGTAQTGPVKAGGYNFLTDPDAPVQVPVQSLVDSETHYFVGAADIPLYYDAFPDFAPFTQAKIHLPYIGEMTLDINKFQGGKIAVDYNCDVISGNVCAVITCQDRNNRRREVYTATGNAAYTLPVFSESQSGAAVGKLIGSGVMAAVTGNAAGVLGAAAGAVEMAAVGVPHSPQIQGSFGGNVGAIGNRICFLEITRPEWVETERFQELSGIPSGLSGTIAELQASGFIQVQTIETDGIAATQAECDLIEQILKSGIYVK